MFGIPSFHLDLYLIRHGQSVANTTPEIICGRSDHSPLTEKGERQAISLGKSLAQRDIKFDAIYSSIAKRASKTAELACAELGYEKHTIQESEQLVEISRGNWEGKHRDEMFTPDKLKAFFEQPWTFKAPEGESCQEVEDRMYGWLESTLLNQLNGDLQTVAVFSHGTAIRCLLRRLMESTPHIAARTHIRNTAVCRLMLNDMGWWVHYVNEYVHIRGL